VVTINETHIKITREIASQSPCVRRKYGCLITNGEFTTITSNQRVSKCCMNGCVRDNLDFKHGQAADVGAEIHAEQAALIKWQHEVDKNTKILIQGYFSIDNSLMVDKSLFPCHVCALMIKYAGFKNINITDQLDRLYSVTIEDVIAHREGEWESYLVSA
jgi:deoxycytidylate deaminase